MTDLRPASVRLPAGDGRQCRAFLCVRDEADRLPFLLSYYRRLGVEWFFAVDNGSTDGTLEYLAEQPDCAVFVTTASYAQANFGMHWINELIASFGTGHWCLFVDADELLVYPHVEQVSLPRFCAWLESVGASGVYGFLLDMYPHCSIAEASYAAGVPFADVAPFFDADYSFRRRLRLAPRRPFPPMEVAGGPRLRRFYPEYLGASMWDLMLPRGLTKLRSSRVGRLAGAPRWLKVQPSPPLLSKVPLTFGAAGRHYRSSHKTVPLALAPVTCALLHFKFFADFHQRAVKALAEGQHFDGGSEYARYLAALEAEPGFSLYHEASLRFQSSAQLVRCGLLRSDPGYDTYCDGLAADAMADPHEAALDQVAG